MTKQATLILVALGASTLSGCSLWQDNPVYGKNGVVRDRSQDYEQAQATKRLELPAGMESKKVQDKLIVPHAGITATARAGKFEVPRPEFFYVEAGSDQVNMRHLDGQKVIVVDEPIADVWVKLEDFWKYNDIKLSRVDPRKGIMETDWITLKGDQYGMVDSWIKRLTFQDIKGPTRNKLRISVRPDPDNYGRTSIRLQHVQFPFDQQVSSIDWSHQARDVEYKSDMMFELLRYLSKATKPTTQSLVALEQHHASKPLFGRDSHGNPVLKLSESADKAWSALNKALDDAKIDVGTRDQKAGKVYLTYVTTLPASKKDKMGFFQWLNSDRGPITISTDFLGSGDGSAKNGSKITYTSGKTAKELAGKTNESGVSGAGNSVAPELSDPSNPANKKGYKIWFAGKVIYVFGDNQNNSNDVYNKKTGKYQNVGHYQLKLNRTRSGVFLSVLTDQGVDAPSIVAEDILWTVKEHLPSTQG